MTMIFSLLLCSCLGVALARRTSIPPTNVSADDKASKKPKKQRAVLKMKTAAFKVSWTYNREMFELKDNEWALWTSMPDAKGKDSRIILGQLPSNVWADQYPNGTWKSLNSTTFASFVKAQGIVADLAVVEPFEWERSGVAPVLEELGVDVKLISLADFGGTDSRQLFEGVQYMQDVLFANKTGRLYMHCKAGRGRSAAMLMAYLCTPQDTSAEALDPATAHFLIKSARPHINVDSPKVRDIHKYVASEILGVTDPVFLGKENVQELHVKARQCLWKHQHVDDFYRYGSTTSHCAKVMGAYKKELYGAVSAEAACGSRGAQYVQWDDRWPAKNGNRKGDALCFCAGDTLCADIDWSEQPGCPQLRKGSKMLNISRSFFGERYFYLMDCPKCQCSTYPEGTVVSDHKRVSRLKNNTQRILRN